MMNDKIKTALGGAGGSVSVSETKKPDSQLEPDVPTDDATSEKRTPNINTTEEELEAYFIVKNLLSEIVPIQEITYKDTESYINILYKANTRKWICRLKLTETQKLLIVPDENKKEMRFQLQDIYEISQHKGLLIEVLKRYI